MKMKLSGFAAAAAALTLAVSLAGCSQSTSTDKAAEETTTAAETGAKEAAETTAASEESVKESAETAASAADDGEKAAAVRVGSLKGPTTIGIIGMMAEDYSSDNEYEFTIATQASELMAQMISADLDIALLPANAAATLYNKTEGAVEVIDINTLGVLYCVTGDESIKSAKDLEGRTVVLTGQGTTPEYSLKYVLEKNGIDAQLEFKSEAAEVVSALSADPALIGLLPQPFATAALAKSESLHSAFSLSDEWDAVSDGSRMVTGVTVVRRDFLDENADAVKVFLADHRSSAAKAVEDVAATAELVVAKEIIAAKPIAEKAIPLCNIVCIESDDMKNVLSGYLNVLYEADAASVGGALPKDDFYFTGK